MIGEEGDALTHGVPQRRLTRGGQAVDAVEQRARVRCEVDKHTGLRVEADEGDLIVRLLRAHELPSRGLGLLELPVLVHRARRVDDEHDAHRRVRAPEGDSIEAVDELAVLPEVDVGKIGRRTVQLGRDDDLGELGGVDRPDHQLAVGERRLRPSDGEGGQDEREDSKDALHLYLFAVARLLNAWVAKSSAPSLTPTSWSFSAKRGRMPVAFRWPLKRPF